MKPIPQPSHSQSSAVASPSTRHPDPHPAARQPRSTTRPERSTRKPSATQSSTLNPVKAHAAATTTPASPPLTATFCIFKPVPPFAITIPLAHPLMTASLTAPSPDRCTSRPTPQSRATRPDTTPPANPCSTTPMPLHNTRHSATQLLLPSRTTMPASTQPPTTHNAMRTAQ
jgi:hypothetical protein